MNKSKIQISPEEVTVYYLSFELTDENWKKIKKEYDYALRVVINGKERAFTFEELKDLVNNQ